MRDLRNVSVKLLESGILIQWNALSLVGLVSVHVSTDPDALPEPATRIARVPMMNGQFLWAPEDVTQRYYFWLLPDSGKPVQVAQRILPAEGISNFRDLGGYPTLDGRYVRWGRLYRAAACTALTERDATLLRRLGLRTVVDYCLPEEQRNRSACLAESVRQVALPILDAETVAAWGPEALDSVEHIRQAIQAWYAFLAGHAQAQRGYGAMLRLCLQADHAPLLQQCATGSGETAVGAAILLLLLGVAEDLVLDDYLLSNECSMQPAWPQQEDQELRAALTTAQYGYLSAFLGEMKAAYGTVERYAIDGLGLTEEELAQLRQIYLAEV